MSWYIGILIWLAAASFLTSGTRTKQRELVLGKCEIRFQWIWAIIIFLPLIIWAGNRYIYFGDTNMYKKTFESMPQSFSEISAYLETIDKDTGFYALSCLIKTVIGNKYRVYFLILAIFQGICVVSLYRKYSSEYITALFIFVATSDYFSYMQNGIRQFMAVSIILAGTTFLFEKKYVRYILIILMASTMHQSALLMIPVIFIVQGKAWNKRTIFLLIIALVAVVYVDQFTDILDDMLSDTQYTNVVSDWKSWDDNGTNPLRVLVYSIPTILSLWGLRYIKQADDPVINISTNMSIVTTGLFLISMFTSGIFIGRLPIYTSTYAMGILLPWEINNFFEKNSVRLVKVIMISGFLVFYYYQMHFAWGVI